MKTFKQLGRSALGGHLLLAIWITGWLATSSLTAAPYNDAVSESSGQQSQNVTPEQQPLLTGFQALAANNAYQVRVVYMIPSNRSPQPDAQRQLQDLVLRMRVWYGEEMARLGYGNKSFLYETEADGVTPKINFLYLKGYPDTYFQGTDQESVDRWYKILDAVAYPDRVYPSIQGFPIWNPGELFLVFAETQIQANSGAFYVLNANGEKVQSAFVGGASATFTGVGVLSGDILARLPMAFLTDNRPYAGLRIDTIGAYPLVQDLSFPWYEGTTMSSVSSSGQGAAFHELGEGLGLWHDFRNDSNFNGNSVANGLRGVRGVIYPSLYPNDDIRLSSGSALQLNYNRFFNNGKVFTENNPPFVDILTTSDAVPVNGQCSVKFSASDTDSNLAGALLIKDAVVVADMRLSGKSVTTSLATYDYVPGQMSQWNIQIIDAQGNMTLSPGKSFTCLRGFNRAPQPFVRVSKRQLKVGEKTVLDAGLSVDPDGNASNMTVQWDLNGDGVFDTSSSTKKTYTTTYRNPGVYQIVARLTDEQRHVSKSVAIGIRVVR